MTRSRQRLVPSTDGKRAALRADLAFDSRLRTLFLETVPEQWPGLPRKAAEEQRRSHGVAIGNTLRAGRITAETAAYELRETG
jgi:hypothetical protein